MGNPVTAQLVGHYLPRLTPMTPSQPTKKSLGSLGVAPLLEKDIDDIPILIDGTPQAVLLAPDLDEDLIDIKRVAETSMLAAQAPSKLRPKLDVPKADRLAADDNAPFGQQVFYVSVAQIESMV